MEKSRSPFASRSGMPYWAPAHSRTRCSPLQPASDESSDVLSPPGRRDTHGVLKTVSHDQHRPIAEKQLTPTEKKFADAQDAFIDHIGQLWNANLESHYRQLVPGTARVQLSISPEGELVKTRVLSNTSNELAAQLIIDAIRPAIRLSGDW